MSSQPEAPDSAVETPAPHKAEVPQGEVLPEPAEPPSEWQIDDDLIASLTNVPGSSIVNKSELEGYRAKLKLYRGHMKALFVAFDQLEKDFNKLVSDTKPYNPPAPKGKIVSAWHSVGNRNAACSLAESTLFGRRWAQPSNITLQESTAPSVVSSSISKFGGLDPSGRVAE